MRLGLCAEAARGARRTPSEEPSACRRSIRDIPDWRDDAQAILDAMYQDKKVERGALTFILLRGIGQAFIAKSVDANEVLALS